MTDQVKFADLTTKKARVAHLRGMLATNATWAQRGLVRIFENQTADEQDMDATTDSNGIGFTGADAEFLSSLAKQFQDRGSLSAGQMGYLYKKMPKYAGQLERVSAPVNK